MMLTFMCKNTVTKMQVAAASSRTFKHFNLATRGMAKKKKRGGNQQQRRNKGKGGGGKKK